MSGVLNVLLAIVTDLVFIADRTVSDTVADPSDAFARFELQSDGDVQIDTGTPTDVGDWIVPKASAGAAYECQAILNSGTSPSGSALSTWLALSTTRGWDLTQTVIGSTECNLTVQIRNAASQVVLTSATIDLAASVES